MKEKKPKQTFSAEVKQLILNIQGGYCGHDGCLNTIHSIHHKLPNKRENEKYTLLLHSPINAIGLCEWHHRNNSHNHKINCIQAQIFEEYLQSIYELGLDEGIRKQIGVEI